MLHCIGKNDKKKNQWVQVFAFFHSQYFQCVLIECVSQKAAEREDFLHLSCSLWNLGLQLVHFYEIMEVFLWKYYGSIQEYFHK